MSPAAGRRMSSPGPGGRMSPGAGRRMSPGSGRRPPCPGAGRRMSPGSGRRSSGPGAGGRMSPGSGRRSSGPGAGGRMSPSAGRSMSPPGRLTHPGVCTNAPPSRVTRQEAGNKQCRRRKNRPCDLFHCLTPNRPHDPLSHGGCETYFGGPANRTSPRPTGENRRQPGPEPVGATSRRRGLAARPEPLSPSNPS